MSSILQMRGDSVTFAITLPVCGTLDDYVEALKRSCEFAAATRSPAAHQAVSVVHALAERGLLAFYQDGGAPSVPKQLSDTDRPEGS